MKNYFILYVIFHLFIFIGQSIGQNNFYIIGEAPTIFSSLENKLKAEELDSVLALSIRIIEKQSDPKIKGIAYFYQGQVSSILHEGNFASLAYQQAIQLFETAKYKKGLALAYAKEADEYFFRLEFHKADSLYNYSLQFSNTANLYQPLIDTYQKKANISIANQQTEKGIEFLKSAFYHSLSKKEKYHITDLANQISTNFHAIGKLDSAIFYFHKLMDIKKEIGDSEGLISDYSTLGNLYRERGEYKKAQNNLMSALEIAEEEKDSFAIITLFTELGDIHATQNIWETAETYYLQASDMAKIKKRTFSEAGCNKKLGDIYLQQNKKEEAVNKYEKALSLFEKLNNKTGTADVLVQLSEIYKKGSEYEKAKTLLLEALEIRKYSQDLLSTLAIKYSLASIELKNGNFNNGIRYAEECLAECKVMNDKEGLKKNYELLADAYAQKGDFKKAFQYHQAYTSVKDSLNSIELGKAIKELDSRYNTEKKDKEIAQKNEKIKAQQIEILKKNNQLLLLASGLTLLGLLAALLIFIYLKNKQINKQKIAVLEKEKEAEKLRSVIEGEEKERKRFAQELHDGLGAMLATVKMQINGIKRNIPEAENLITYQKAESLIDNACRSVREISHGLMPYVLEQQGLIFALQDMCQNMSGQSDITIDFISFGDDKQLNDVQQITLFRIAQELSKNAINHAEATEIIVQLTIEENEVMLIVEDDGKGFDINDIHTGIGLENIRSRINYLNGELNCESIVNEGSTFTVHLPIDEL